MLAFIDKGITILLLLLDKDSGSEIDYKISLNYISCLFMVALLWYYVWTKIIDYDAFYKNNSDLDNMRVIPESPITPFLLYDLCRAKYKKLKWDFLQIILVDSYTISIHPDNE